VEDKRSGHMIEHSTVEFERRGVVALLTLNRPDAMNAIDGSMRTELPAAVRRAEDDPNVRVIVVAGAGTRAFCAGADVREFNKPQSVVEARAERQRTGGWNDVLEAVRKPTIAAIRGYCLGGGLEIALACDVRIAAEGATLGLPEVGLGLIPGAGGTQRLQRIVGLGHALWMTLSGERITAARALEIGLVTQLVSPAETLLDSVLETAERLGCGAPLAMAYAKEAVRRGGSLPMGEGLRIEDDLATLLLGSEDRTEGVQAFREKRTPAYRGR
jgi:enoyl-CoA hydratase/carnithine racemase